MRIIRNSLPASVIRIIVIGIAAAGLPVGLSGCASTADPSVAAASQPSPALETGAYPNLNILPKPAADPLSEADKASLNSRISAAENAQAASGRQVKPQSDPAAIKRLAAHHADDTLRAIEGK